MWTADTAYDTAFDAGGRADDERLSIARRWCEIGLELNPFRRPLRVLKTGLLARDSLRDAIDYWERYVDWHFWDPGNHALLAELYAEDGDFGKAMQSLRWVQGSEHYEAVRSALQDAWRNEISSPPSFSMPDR